MTKVGRFTILTIAAVVVIMVVGYLLGAAR